MSEIVLDPQQKELLNLAYQRRPTVDSSPLADNIARITPLALDCLASYGVLGMDLDFVGIKQFFESADLLLPNEEIINWLTQCLEQNLLDMAYAAGNDDPHFICPSHVAQYCLTHLDSGELKLKRLKSAGFYSQRLALSALELGFDLPEGEQQQAILIGPHGFLDQIAHLPQYQTLHHGILNYALNWHEHLFQLGEFNDAANILNSVCFALSRRGQRKLAKDLLARITSRTRGLTNLVARVNLATLWREEYQLSRALRIYWRTIPGLLWQRSFIQLAQVLTEMSAIYRQTGNLMGSAVVLEFCVILNGWLKNDKSQAIARSQLASTYRYLRLYTPALSVSKDAIAYFERTNDLLNLGRSLLTRGNIYYNLKMTEPATACFESALHIGRQIADPQAEIGALSGKARVIMLLDCIDEAKSLLEEAIAKREQRNDHSVGIEYQNLGAFYEKKGKITLALGWHQKALNEFERYLPVEAPRCRKKIARLEKKLQERGKIDYQ